MRKILVAFLAVVLTVCCAVGLVACNPDGNGVVDVTGITLDETEITLTEGEYYNLTATITPSYANDHSMEWTSSDNEVATVDNGYVSAKAEGEATITVTTGNGKTATCTVTVKPKEPELPVKYTVTFYAFGGEFEDGALTYDVEVEEGAKIESVEVTRGTEYEFTAWYKDEYHTMEWDLENDTVYEDTELYAGWRYLNKYQSVIDALADRTKTELQDDSAEVEILMIYTDSDGYLCFAEKDGTGAYTYKTGLCGYDTVKGNAELIAAIPTTTLTQLKNYKDIYTSDNDALLADGMAYRYSGADNVNEAIIYSCVSAMELDTEEHYTTNGPWYSCKVRAILAADEGIIYDCSFTVVAGVEYINAVANGTVLSEEFDMVKTELGEVANDFYAERIKELNSNVITDTENIG